MDTAATHNLRSCWQRNVHLGSVLLIRKPESSFQLKLSRAIRYFIGGAFVVVIFYILLSISYTSLHKMF